MFIGWWPNRGSSGSIASCSTQVGPSFWARSAQPARFALRTLVALQDLPGKDEDVQWATKASIRLIAHPQLTAAQREMVREEYMQGTSGLRFEVEVPLVQYVIQAYRAGLDPQRHPAPDYLLMVDQPESLPDGAIWH